MSFVMLGARQAGVAVGAGGARSGGRGDRGRGRARPGAEAPAGTAG
jgi:hypothetical protein